MSPLSAPGLAEGSFSPGGLADDCQPGVTLGASGGRIGGGVKGSHGLFVSKEDGRRGKGHCGRTETPLAVLHVFPLA